MHCARRVDLNPGNGHHSAGRATRDESGEPTDLDLAHVVR